MPRIALWIIGIWGICVGVFTSPLLLTLGFGVFALPIALWATYLLLRSPRPSDDWFAPRGLGVFMIGALFILGQAAGMLPIWSFLFGVTIVGNTKSQDERFTRTIPLACLASSVLAIGYLFYFLEKMHF